MLDWLAKLLNKTCDGSVKKILLNISCAAKLHEDRPLKKSGLWSRKPAPGGTSNIG